MKAASVFLRTSPAQARHSCSRAAGLAVFEADMTEAEIQSAGRRSSLEVMRGYVGLTPARQGVGGVLAHSTLAAG